MPILVLTGGPFDGCVVVSRDANAGIPYWLGFARGGACDSSFGDAAKGPVMFDQWQMQDPPTTTDETDFPPWAPHADYHRTDQIDDQGRIVFEFAPPSVVTLKLASLLCGSTPMARSQAKRLLERVKSPVRLTLDFAGIESVGHSFADEIFRVWENSHPESLVTYTNANSAVEAVIRRARKTC